MSSLLADGTVFIQALQINEEVNTHHGILDAMETDVEHATAALQVLSF
jgi:hypothetical protein